MLTTDQIRAVAETTLKEHALGLCDYLNRSDTYHAGMLAALLEIFAEKLEAARSMEIVAVLDEALGDGWTRRVAERICENSNMPSGRKES